MFFQGIVENNIDPEKLGRVQVRIVGKHPQNRSDDTNVHEYLPTSDLPWAIQINPANTSVIDGISNFAVPENGSVVLCGFFDKAEQYPFFIGVIGKKVLELPDFTQGFSDPNNVHPSEAYIDKSPISKLALGEDNDIITGKKSGVNSDISEPETQYAPVYPSNKVMETKGGHVIEIDDTTGKERIHFYHKSGSFIEMHPNGDVVTKVKGNYYTDASGTIKRAGTDVTEKVSTLTIDASGDISIIAGGDVTVEGVNVDVTASGNVTITGTKVDIN